MTRMVCIMLARFERIRIPGGLSSVLAFLCVRFQLDTGISVVGVSEISVEYEAALTAFMCNRLLALLSRWSRYLDGSL